MTSYKELLRQVKAFAFDIDGVFTDGIIFTYADENPNGSVENIAGIVNKEGNVLGMMPHPERAMEELLGGADGVHLFASVLKNFVGK